MGNLKYLLPSDEGILQFLSYITEIWSRDQFFHENQLCFRSGVIFWWNKGCKRGKFLFLSDFLGVSYRGAIFDHKSQDKDTILKALVQAGELFIKLLI